MLFRLLLSDSLTQVHLEVLTRITQGVEDLGFGCQGIIESPLKGDKSGNTEFLAHFVRSVLSSVPVCCCISSLCLLAFEDLTETIHGITVCSIINYTYNLHRYAPFVHLVTVLRTDAVLAIHK
jgi:hypothetical protein